MVCKRNILKQFVIREAKRTLLLQALGHCSFWITTILVLLSSKLPKQQAIVRARFHCDLFNLA